MRTRTLYERLTDAGVATSNWYSDLYFPATQQTAEIIRAATDDGHKLILSQFRSCVDGQIMYEAAFQFDPFWESLAKRARDSQEAQQCQRD